MDGEEAHVLEIDAARYNPNTWGNKHRIASEQKRGMKLLRTCYKPIHMYTQKFVQMHPLPSQLQEIVSTVIHFKTFLEEHAPRPHATAHYDFPLLRKILHSSLTCT